MVKPSHSSWQYLLPHQVHFSTGCLSVCLTWELTFPTVGDPREYEADAPESSLDLPLVVTCHPFCYILFVRRESSNQPRLWERGIKLHLLKTKYQRICAHILKPHTELPPLHDCSFTKYLLSSCYVPGTVLGSGDSTMNRTVKNSWTYGI